MRAKINELAAKSAVARVASPFGFSQASEDLWLRKWGWKSDRIDLHCRNSNFLVSVAVIVPSLGGEGIDFQGLASNNAKSENDESSIIPYPRSSRDIEWSATVDVCLATAFRWFDFFDTPRKCESWIREGGKVAGSDAYLAGLKYLGLLRKTEDVVCCMVDCPVQLDSKISRELFLPDFNS